MAKKLKARSDLTPDPANANAGTERGAYMVEHSLEQYGAGRSILADRDGVVLAGNKTLEAAERLDLPIRVVETDGRELVVVQRTDLALDEGDRARLLAYADNRAAEVGLAWDTVQLAADTGAGLDLSGLWTADELAGVLGQPTSNGAGPNDAPTRQDRATELQQAWQVQHGQVWRLGNHRLACGDCTDEVLVARLLEGATPDALVTDPPYSSGGFQESGRAAGSIGTGAKDKPQILNDRLSTRGYMALIRRTLQVVPAGVVYIFTDWRQWVNLYDVVESSGYVVRNMIVWDKGTPGMGQGWRSEHELVMFGSRVAHKFDSHKAVGNVLHADRTGNQLHATEKPIEILASILYVTNWAETVYDPFLGSGTTLMAAQHHGRRCFGVDLAPEYVAVTLQRWMDAGGESPELLPS